MSVLFRCYFKTLVIFIGFLKVAITTPNFMKEIYNGGLMPEFGVSMLKETIKLVQVHVKLKYEIFLLWKLWKLIVLSYVPMYT